MRNLVEGFCGQDIDFHTRSSIDLPDIPPVCHLIICILYHSASTPDLDARMEEFPVLIV